MKCYVDPTNIAHAQAVCAEDLGKPTQVYAYTNIRKEEYVPDLRDGKARRRDRRKKNRNFKN